MKVTTHYAVAILFAALSLVALATALRLSAEGVIKSSFDYFSYTRPALHTDSSFFSEGGTTVQAPKPPAISARAYLVGNVSTGEIYVSYNAGTPMPVASMSKLVTAIVATDTLDPLMQVTISQDQAALPADTTDLMAGERFAVKDLLYPMLISSSNVAAEAIASSKNRALFMQAMTGYAWEIGMPSAYFADPSGLDPQNSASAEDIFALSRYLYKSRPDILAITRAGPIAFATTSEHGGHRVVSTHPFAADSRFLGGKTGRTPEAGETMLTILRIGGQPIAVVVLGSAFGTREWDTKVLIDRYTGRAR